MCEQLVNMKFVEEVEKHPLLYNYNLPEYSRKDLIEEAWKEVGKEMNLSVAECKVKWKNLRAVFVRHLKREVTRSRSGKKRPYYLTDVMQFTLPFIKAVMPCVEEYVPKVKEETETYEVDEDYQLQAPSPVSVPLEEPSTSSQQEQRAYTPQNDESSYQSYNDYYNVNPGHKEKKRSIDEVDDVFMEHVKSHKSAFHTTPNIEKSHAKKMFLLSLLPELDELDDQQMKMFKRKVLQLIDDIQDGFTLPFTSSTSGCLSAESPTIPSPVPSPTS